MAYDEQKYEELQRTLSSGTTNALGVIMAVPGAIAGAALGFVVGAVRAVYNKDAFHIADGALTGLYVGAIIGGAIGSGIGYVIGGAFKALASIGKSGSGSYVKRWEKEYNEGRDNDNDREYC